MAVAVGSRLGGAIVIMLLGLVFATLCASVASDTAFIVVNKKANLVRAKQTEKITVFITLYNAGTSTAYDVSLNDNTWPSEIFSLVSGNTSNTWDKLEAGGSLTHNFMLESKVKGPFNGSPALVKFRIAAKSALQEAYSTPLEELDILSDKPAENRLNSLKKFGLKYAPLLVVLSIISIFAFLLISPSKSKKFSKAGKKRR